MAPPGTKGGGGDGDGDGGDGDADGGGGDGDADGGGGGSKGGVGGGGGGGGISGGDGDADGGGGGKGNGGGGGGIAGEPCNTLAAPRFVNKTAESVNTMTKAGTPRKRHKTAVLVGTRHVDSAAAAADFAPASEEPLPVALPRFFTRKRSTSKASSSTL